jgi:toxin-antitoxin system PIN domain toxin
VIAVDTNLLVYAHRADSPWHERARRAIVTLAEGRKSWAIPWPCVHEFLSVVTHPRIYDPPSTLEQAAEQVGAWLESPSLVLLSEVAEYWPLMRATLAGGRITGPRVHDARIAALCEVHGVSELWTQDRDFSRFPDLRTTSPLVE